MDLSSRVVVVTGASTGLGAGMASWFVEQGAAVGVCARRTPDAPSGGSVTMSVDVTDRDAIGRFAEEVSSRLGPIDLWINNAAVLEPIIAQMDLTYSTLESHLAVNVGGVLNGTQAFLDRLRSDESTGALVNISSGLAQKGRAGLTAYSVGKAAVDRMTEVIAVEEADLLTMALAVSPGVIETGMQATLRGQDESVLHDVGMFREFADDGSMNSPAWIASRIADWVFGGVDPGGVIVRIPRESA